MTTRSVSIKNLRANIAKELEDLPFIVTKRKKEIALVLPIVDVQVEPDDSEPEPEPEPEIDF